MNKSFDRKYTFFSSAFTIIELLIVIVIIGILVAIVATSYNGITKQANDVAALAEAKEASKSLELFKAKSSRYPSKEEANLPKHVQYTPSEDRSTFCLTSESNNISYYINTTTAKTPTRGVCEDHTVAGVKAVTNLAINPRATSNNIIYSNSGIYTTITRGVSLPEATPDGITIGAESAVTSGASSDSILSAYNLDGLLNSYPGKRHFSLWVRSNTNTKVFEGSGAQAAEWSAANIPANTWVRVFTEIPAQPNTHSGLRVGKGSGIFANESDRVWITGIMATDTDEPVMTFADGDTEGWRWTGQPNASSSVGIPVK